MQGLATGHSATPTQITDFTVTGTFCQAPSSGHLSSHLILALHHQVGSTAPTLQTRALAGREPLPALTTAHQEHCLHTRHPYGFVWFVPLTDIVTPLIPFTGKETKAQNGSVWGWSPASALRAASLEALGLQRLRPSVSRSRSSWEQPEREFSPNSLSYR